MSETETPALTAEAAEPGDAAPARPRETRVERILPAVEAVLFSSPKPVKERELAELLEAAPDAVAEALASLAARYEADDRGIRVEKVAGGWRFVTRPEFDALLRKYHEVTERSRLSLAALETLAIIAYRQPITLPEIQEIRGVNSSSVLKTLFEKKLISTAGKKPVVGTPFFYRTTQDFLVRFGLNELTELPKPEDLDADLAATVEAREIAAPTATLSGIHVEHAIHDPDAGADEFDEPAETLPAAALPGPAPALRAGDAGADDELDDDEELEGDEDADAADDELDDDEDSDDEELDEDDESDDDDEPEDDKPDDDKPEDAKE
ncbi:MAG TPA: SMC-Scp complex subunit ScpB [Thermoanaerobaculia bacterium]|jgi:segregation and condensation protein B|nr:SMC-Scp complex subunit ScpB [Thermoanaerobaculia bacterium]